MTATVLLHLLAIAHGLAASLASFFVLYLAGRLLTPRRWDATLGSTATSGFIGAAALVLTGWYGIAAGVRLSLLLAGYLAAVLLLSAIRWRRTRSIIGQAALSWPARRSAGLFGLLYVLAYLYTLPPVTASQLPLAWLGNIDLLYYLNETAYVLRLGPVSHPVISTDYFAYFQTPGAFPILGAFSAFFGFSPMNAMMPAAFSLVALCGLMCAGIARRVFRTSPLGSAIVGAAAVSAPFFRYIAGHYYFSTLLTLPVLLHLLFLIATRRAGKRLLSLPLACSLFAHHALLFFIYPFLFLVSLFFETVLVCLRAFALRRATRLPWLQIVRDALARALPAAAALCAVIATAPLQAVWALRMIVDLRHPGIAGWVLDVISPVALVGLPTALGKISVGDAGVRPWAMAGLLAIVVLSAAAFLWPTRHASDVPRRAFLGLASVGFLAYLVYVTRTGSSYQQWKLASYVAMPYSFVFVAALVGLVERRRPARAQQVAFGHRRKVWVWATGAVLVVGNLAVHAAVDPPLHRFPSAVRNVGSLVSLRFRDLSVETTDHYAHLAIYYLPGKRLHFTGTRLGYEEPLSLADISPARPFLGFGYDCGGAGHGETMPVEGVGCLFLQPPSLALETDYSFGRNYLFVEHGGLGVREDWGRWNGRRSATIKVTVDQRRARVHDAGYVNLELQPCLAPGMAAQRIRLTWGAGRSAELLLSGREWVSLPVGDTDWVGEWIATQTISMEFPDLVPPHWVEAASGRYRETRSLAVGFLSVAVTSRPRGRVVS